jgi:hypothetical protein
VSCSAALLAPLRRAVQALASALALSGALALSACIVVPQTQTVYDPECQVMTRQVTLEAAVLGGFTSCTGEGCAAMLATLGFVTAASAVVSGSIAIVANTVYWIERQGRCNRGPAGAASAAAK